MIKILSVDFQREFSALGGRFYKPRGCTSFFHQKIVPLLRARNEQLAEIISDYRLHRPSETEAYCVPGTWGFESEVPIDLVGGRRWIKSMNSPSWTRAHAGDPTRSPGDPYCAPSEFGEWLTETIGPPAVDGKIILIGLTLDCCVLSTAQELYYRGYRVNYLAEGVDTYNGTPEEKESLFQTPLSMWGKVLRWSDLSQVLAT
ncbi:isochorismatase family protein [Ramlibacter sp. WS9]|uniref:isochorismatase family protein n=1 Tax=Ramlibacter sp. WS9 TaxID=1882741 RepID=UPI0011431820|nr:isochorismatase family protein [Ramlibacter sp. WS9]ROZ63428.1 isochorismatase family protein [Ramlibacter sp. WS9]